MLWYVPVIVYGALACATVKPPAAPAPAPTASAPTVPSTQPVPNWAFVCKSLNEQGVQKHPSLNPG